MPSKFLVPFEVPDYQGVPVPSTADAGFVLAYIKYGWWTKHDGTAETDLVLQRPLDGFTEVDRYANPVTASDTVLSAMEKIQRSLSTLKLVGDVTGNAQYMGGELIIQTTGGGIDCTELLNCQVIIDIQGNLTTLDQRLTDLENAPEQPFLATEFDNYHFSGYGTAYVAGDVVYYQGRIYQALANNDGVTPVAGGNVYWADLGVGARLRQILSDWNATTGEAQILNKPTSLSDFTNDPGFITTYSETDTLDSVTTRGNSTANDVKIDGNVYLATVTGTTNTVRIGHTDPAVAFVDIRPSYAGPNIGLYIQNPGVTGNSYTLIAQAQQTNPSTDNIAGYFNAQGGNTNTAIRTDYGNNLLNALGGNLLVGTTTDAGFKLDVAGYTRIFDPSGGSIEFYAVGGGGGPYTSFNTKPGTGSGPTVEYFGDTNTSLNGIGFYGPDSTYQGMLIYAMTSSVEDIMFLSSQRVALPRTQLITWAASSNAIDTPQAGIARNQSGWGAVEINDGTSGGYDTIVFKNARVTDLAGTGTRMVVVDSVGVLNVQAIPSGSTGTVTSVGLTTGTTGNDINVSGSPITTLGTFTLNIPNASTSARGVVNITTQSFTGEKTFVSPHRITPTIQAPADGSFGSYIGTTFQFFSNLTNRNLYGERNSASLELGSYTLTGSNTYNVTAQYNEMYLSGGAGSTQPFRAMMTTLVGNFGKPAMNISDFRFIEIKTPDPGGVTGHTVSTATGLYINPIGGASDYTIVNSYGIRQMGGNDINEFNGPMIFAYYASATDLVLTIDGAGNVNARDFTHFGLQAAMIYDSILTQDNTIDGGGFHLLWDNLAKVQFNSAAFVDINVNDTVQQARVMASIFGGGDAYVSLYAAGPSGESGIDVMATGLYLKTLDYTAASTGWVLTLVDPSTGEVEYAAPSGGGGGGVTSEESIINALIFG